MPSMHSWLDELRTQLPSLIDRGEALLVTAEEIVARLPESLDRSDRFFANVDRVFQESDIPELSDEARQLFETTTAERGSMRC